MSIEHTNTNTNNAPNTDTQQAPRHRKRKRPPRTKRWYHDSQVGVEDLKGYVLARYFISIAEDETPEIFLVPMNREPIEREDGTYAMKSTYAGDIERNAIPLSTLDLDAFYTSLVNAKARLMRMQQEFHARAGREVTQPPPSQPKRSQQQPQPLTHRLTIPKAVLKQMQDVPPNQPTTPETAPKADSNADSSSLDKLLPGW